MSALHVGVAGLIAVVATGCASRCAEIEASRVAFFAQRAPSTRAPQLAVAIPFALVDRELAVELAAAAPPIELPLPAEVAALVPTLAHVHVVVTGIAMRTTTADRLGLRVALALVDSADRDDPIVSLTANLDAVATIAHRADQLEIALAPIDVGGVHPVLGPGASDALADAIVRRLHLSATAAVFAHGTIERAATRITQWLAGHSLEYLLGPVLPRVRDAATVRIGIGGPAGAVPITEIHVAPSGDGVVLTARFDLPIASGLATLPALAGADVVRVRVAGPTLAALANWAIATHVLPDRYDGSKPSSTGSLTPGLAWEPGARPLKLHLWRRASPCMHAEIGTAPSLAIAADGKLHIELRTPVIEHLVGNFLIHARMWFYTFALDGAIAAHVALSVAHQRVELATVAASADADGVALDLRVTATAR